MRISTPVALLLALIAALPVRADEALEARLREQLRAAVTSQRQLQIENATLKADLEKAKAEVAKSAENTEGKAELEEAKNALAAETERAAGLEAQIGKAQTTLGEWKKSYEQAVALARSRDAEAKKFEALHREVSTHVEGCENNNATLVSISEELLARYKKKGVIDAARDREPILGIHRIKLEELAQQYHHRIVDAAVTPLAPESMPAQPAADTGSAAPQQTPAETPQ